jgi:cytochrome b involved in lipid metabolism
MKKTVFSVFVAFWASVGTMLALHAMAPDHATSEEASLPVYTLADVAEHATLDDCWMAIEGKVYDFTGYIPDHPTPPFVMEQWCGKEATEGMRTKGYGRDHSAAAWAMMAPYQVGTLADD